MNQETKSIWDQLNDWEGISDKSIPVQPINIAAETESLLKPTEEITDIKIATIIDYWNSFEDADGSVERIQAKSLDEDVNAGRIAFVMEEIQPQLEKILPILFKEENERVGSIKLSKDSGGFRLVTSITLAKDTHGNRPDKTFALDEDLLPGEVEIHHHSQSFPKFHHAMSSGDIMSAVEAKPWIDADGKVDINLRVFGIVTIHSEQGTFLNKKPKASLQIYRINTDRMYEKINSESKKREVKSTNSNVLNVNELGITKWGPALDLTLD